MPQALIGAITPYIASAIFAITGSTAAVVAATGFVAAALVYGGLAAAAYLFSAATAQSAAVPKPEDGKYNLKQSVPPLSYVLGRVKKAGDYDFLEERNGVAYHITVIAAHQVKNYILHYLHDEPVGIAPFGGDVGGWVTTPEHFVDNGYEKVLIRWRSGANTSTAYTDIVSVFPEIWTVDHRGDGLATIMMAVNSVAQENVQKVYPQFMPQHSVVVEGHANIYDPRSETYGYATNLALFRLWHLTHPVGGKMTIDDMELADWRHAADVADQTVFDRNGAPLPRYLGGMWFRSDSSPVETGRTMDQAGELVIYEHANGKVGVHAGEFVEPDIRLTAADILSVHYDPNMRRATSVLAVRGRYTDPEKGYNTTDAAIYGNPYPTEDERTKTVANVAVQYHNHIARLQKLAYIRANAPRVTITAHYEPARNIPYRRFVRVHYPNKLDEAVIEILGRPTLSLRAMTYEFEGIVVPSDLYAFNAATEEGAPGSNVVPIDREDVPEPEGFAVVIETETVGGGTTAAYGEATFDLQNASFQYEVEWQPTSGGTPQTVRGLASELAVRTTYLSDGVEYRFRARTWSAGTPSGWTDYQILTATADPVAPGLVTGVSGVGGAGQITFNWTAPNSINYAGARLYWNTANTFLGATLAATEYGAPNAADSRVVTGISVGTRYGFIVSVNGSGIAAAPVATGAVVVT